MKIKYVKLTRRGNEVKVEEAELVATPAGESGVWLRRKLDGIGGMGFDTRYVEFPAVDDQFYPRGEAFQRFRQEHQRQHDTFLWNLERARG